MSLEKNHKIERKKKKKTAGLPIYPESWVLPIWNKKGKLAFFSFPKREKHTWKCSTPALPDRAVDQQQDWAGDIFVVGINYVRGHGGGGGREE